MPTAATTGIPAYADNDLFVFNNLAANRDVVTDFTRGSDKIAIDDVLFNSSTGVLRWDADGRGSAAPVTIATLQNVTTLSVDDFLIV